MSLQKLSIIIPAYNEEDTIELILDRVFAVELTNNISKEIIIVNDGSKDSTSERINSFIQANPDKPIQFIEHDKNKGKGAAVQTGIQAATGDYVLIQDADLEYDPRDYNALIDPVLTGNAEVVYGSRFISGKPHRILFFWHSIGNRLLTFLSNMFSNLNLTDMEVCYKMFKTDIIKDIKLVERSFGFEPEVTAKIAKIKDIKIYEVGISYFGRTYKEGKKINWKDGLRAIYCIIKYNL
ncbi:MAG: glycosyl transferase [Bacteroidetes bacterium]|nr:MAG: glycosyl transferase [Bacteroidota bacterium]